MAEDITEHLTITLRHDGFHIAFSEQAAQYSPKEILAYLGSLNIPQVQLGAVKDAFNQAGKDTYQLFAPPLKKGAPSLQQSQAKRRIVKWIRPTLSAGSPVKTIKNILVVDASNVMVKFFWKSFPNAKLNISLANSFQAFLKAISESPLPELIMIAAELGNTSMRPLAEKVRLGRTTAKIPVIMYSTLRPRQEIIAGFDSGITEYFVMPMKEEVFQAKVKGVLQQVRRNIAIENVKKKGKHAKNSDTLDAEAKKEYSVSMLSLSKKVEKVMAAPFVLDRVMKISDDSVSGAKELAQAVESDTGTTTMVLKKANTAFFGKRDPITKVQDAIVRIGFKEIKTLVLGLSVVKQFSAEQKSNGFNRLEYWKHCLATGILAKLFAQQVKYPEPEKAFLGGLMHDLGKIVFDEHANPPYDDIVMEAMKAREPLYQAEKDALGFTHTNVGKLVLDNWKFPEEYVLLVKRHHDVDTMEKEQAKPQDLLLARLVYIGNVLAKALTAGSAGDLSIFELPLSEWVQQLPQLKFSEDIKAEFQKELAEVGDFLGVGSGVLSFSDGIDESLPAVHILDPLMEVRPIHITKIHLENAGYQVNVHAKIGDLPKDLSVGKFAVCLLLDRTEKIGDMMKNIHTHFQPQNIPVTIMLPEAEKALEDGQKEQEALVAAGHKLLYEPFDVEELQRCLNCTDGVSNE